MSVLLSLSYTTCVQGNTSSYITNDMNNNYYEDSQNSQIPDYETINEWSDKQVI